MVPRILVVDDDESIRTVVNMLLEEEGYEVDQAANGLEALDVLQRQPPDGIVLDLMMPVMDGTRFLEHCREIPNCESIPVIVISATQGILDMAGKDHVKACLAKPFDLDALTALVDQFVSPDSAHPGSV